MDISNVSCYAKLLGPNADQGAIEYIQLLVLASNGALVSASTLAPVAVGQGTTAAIPWRTFAANNAVRVYADAGRHFQALLAHNHAALWELVGCHISGELVTVP